MQASCPYCHSAKSLLLGNVYCSRQRETMQELETGTLFIRTQRLEETADHESRLSIRLSLNGKQHYRVGSDDHYVTPDQYLVVNQGQRYRTDFRAEYPQEMIIVAFQPGFAENFLHTLVTAEDKLLDDPFYDSNQPIQFFEKTYDMDPVIRMLFSQLRTLIDQDIAVRMETDVQDIYTGILRRLLDVHRQVRSDIDQLSSVKLSTRVELYRRLYLAREFLDAHLSRKVSVDEAARIACLSLHHFKRSFKSLFGMSPHQYHISKRLEASCTLLHQLHPVTEVSQMVGFDDVSAFIRLFRQHYHCTPGTFRHGVVAN